MTESGKLVEEYISRGGAEMRRVFLTGFTGLTGLGGTPFIASATVETLFRLSIDSASRTPSRSCGFHSTISCCRIPVNVGMMQVELAVFLVVTHTPSYKEPANDSNKRRQK